MSNYNNIRIFIFMMCLIPTLSNPVFSQDRRDTIDGTNDLYQDHLEFSPSIDPMPISVDGHYTLYGNPSRSNDFYLTFDLDSKQPVIYEVVDVAGRPVSKGEWNDVIDQTFHVECNTGSTGVYMVRLMIAGRYYTNRVLITR